MTYSATFEKELKHYVKLFQLCIVGITPIWCFHSPSYLCLLLEFNTILDMPDTKKKKLSFILKTHTLVMFKEECIV
jgi:hypothetical protein